MTSSLIIFYFKTKYINKGKTTLSSINCTGSSACYDPHQVHYLGQGLRRMSRNSLNESDSVSGKQPKDGKKPEPCKPILKVEYKTTRAGYVYACSIIFSFTALKAILDHHEFPEFWSRLVFAG